MRDFNADVLVVLAGGAVDFAVAVVDVHGDVLGEAVADVAEPAAFFVDVEGVETGRAAPGVGFEVVE